MCQSCKRLSHVSINNSTEINEKFVLACLLTGTGLSHLDSYLSIFEFLNISNQKFKCIERKVGKEIKQIVEESCKSGRNLNSGKKKTGQRQRTLKGLFEVSCRKQRGYKEVY